MHSQTALCSSEPLIYISLKKSLLGLAQPYHFGAEPFETEDVIPELEVFRDFQHQACPEFCVNGAGWCRGKNGLYLCDQVNIRFTQ